MKNEDYGFYVWKCPHCTLEVKDKSKSLLKEKIVFHKGNTCYQKRKVDPKNVFSE
jgi:hypothetical protein